MNDFDEFAVKHRLEWSTAKCKVMKIVKHNGEPGQWKLESKMTEETTQYKYLVFRLKQVQKITFKSKSRAGQGNHWPFDIFRQPIFPRLY